MQEQLFKTWFEEHKSLIFKVVRAYTASPQDRDDLFQQILLQLWSSIPNFKAASKETTWIYRVALNTALVWKRGNVRKRRRHQVLTLDFVQAPVNQTSDTDSIQQEQIVSELYAAIRKLSKTESSIILMYLEGLSYKQMSEILGISTSNVGARLNRAKGRLAQLLKGLIDEF